MAVLDCIPPALVAGDGWAWRDVPAFAAYPAPDWGLSYVLRPLAGGAGVTVAGVVDGAAWLLSVAPAVTAPLAPGVYAWTALATNAGAGDRQTVAAGRITVLPDPAAAVPGDARSAAERILAAIDATLEGRATKDADSYSIEGRSIARTPIADLLRLRNVYAAQVAAELDPRAGMVRFRRISL